MAAEPDWQSLARKLDRGASLEVAAEVCGIDIDEARKWARANLDQIDAADITLQRTAGTMLERGFAVLDRIAAAGQRVCAEEFFDAEGNHTSTKRFSDVDVDAAKAMVSAALSVRKMLGPPRSAKTGRGASATIQLDLWDNKGNWQLEDPE